MKLEIRNLKLVVQIFCSFKFPSLREVSRRETVSSFRRVLQGIFSKTCSVVRCPNDTVVAVIFVGDRKMRELNRKYRGKDKTTNVLAFPASTKIRELNADLGDIFICLPEARREAKKYGWTVRHSVARLALHGFLHLLGYDHVKEKEARKMEEIEKQVLAHLR